MSLSGYLPSAMQFSGSASVAGNFYVVGGAGVSVSEVTGQVTVRILYANMMTPLNSLYIKVTPSDSVYKFTGESSAWELLHTLSAAVVSPTVFAVRTFEIY